MKSLLVLLFCAWFGSTSFAQSTPENFRDMAGTPFFPRQYVDVSGSPYLFEDWVPATITLKDGRALNGVKTNFNLATEELLYVDEAGKTMVANTRVVRSLETNSDMPRKFIATPASNTFFEVISSEGKAVLLKHSKKVIMETKAFNSATIQKSFVTDTSHMLSLNGNVTEIKSLDDLYEILKSDQLKDFAKKEKLKKKSEESWVKIVDYYNSI